MVRNYIRNLAEKQAEAQDKDIEIEFHPMTLPRVKKAFRIFLENYRRNHYRLYRVSSYGGKILKAVYVPKNWGNIDHRYAEAVAFYRHNDKWLLWAYCF
ncbi:MAG: hypothetical protein PHV59_01715 [Victivallales bacterium]|nr:hypothetical protein [Victivallales bacterium]